MNYISAHWEGKQPLWQAFWLNVFILPLIINMALGIILSLLSFIVSDNMFLALASFTIVAVTGMSVWSYVGAWRSAKVYQAAVSGWRACWAYLTYGVLMICMLKLMLTILSLGVQ